MSDCVFCKIVSGEIPCHQIAENNNFMAFLDIQPFSDGHTLVIPKAHFRWTYDVTNFGEYWEFTKTITKKIQNSLHPDFITYLTMGNEVPHAHIHLIPRYSNDSISSFSLDSLRHHPTNEQLSIITAKIKS